MVTERNDKTKRLHSILERYLNARLTVGRSIGAWSSISFVLEALGETDRPIPIDEMGFWANRVLTEQSVKTAIKELTDRGYAEKQSGTRVYYLTERGKAYYSDYCNRIRKSEELAWKDIDDSDIQSALDTLERFCSNYVNSANDAIHR